MEANDIGEISPFKNQKSRQEQNTINMEADDIFEIPPLKKPQCVCDLILFIPTLIEKIPNLSPSCSIVGAPRVEL